MGWFIGSVVLVLIAAWLYWELRRAGRSKREGRKAVGPAADYHPARNAANHNSHIGPI